MQRVGEVVVAAELDTETELATDENTELTKKRWMEALPVLQQMPQANQRELADKTAKLLATSDASNIVMSDGQMLEEHAADATAPDATARGSTTGYEPTRPAPGNGAWWPRGPADGRRHG